jgi:spore coat protein U-like protein
VTRRLVLWAGLMLAAGVAGAATDCRISSGGGLAFGIYDPVSAVSNDSVATVVALCTRDGGPQHITLTLGLSPGTNSTSVNTRRLINTGPAGGYLSYGLFRDAGRTEVWGFSANVDTMSQSISVPNKAGPEPATFTIFGRIPALQDPAVGSYTDAVTLTVTP